MNCKWEYKVEFCTVGPYYDTLVEAFLKPLGAKGWELVHISEMYRIEDRREVHLKAYLKRKVGEPSCVANQ